MRWRRLHTQPTPRRRSSINSLEAVAGDDRVALPFTDEQERVRLRANLSPRRRAAALLRGCRPRQWTKNLLVLAAPCAAGVINRGEIAAQVAAAFAALCLVSSATYLFNDVRDRKRDRLHPTKRRRPVAAGEIRPATALRWAALLAFCGVALASAVQPLLGVAVVGYLALTATYSLWWRDVVVLDIVAIAAGFMLRAVAGGLATDIYLSRWFVIVTGCCAVFLVAAKRYAELRARPPAPAAAPAQDAPTRATLARYSAARLRLTLTLAAGAACGAYIGWAFTRGSHIVLYALSVAPFMLWLVRYGRLVGAGTGEAPEELILRDRALLALSFAWAVLFLGGVYVGR